MARLTVQRLPIETTADVPKTFDCLIATHEPRVRRLAHRLLGWRDGGEVDDVVQDVFLAAFKNFTGFRRHSSIATWLTRITINRCRTHRRSRLLQLRWLVRIANPRVAVADASIEQDETSTRVRAAVQSLKAADREVIVLFHLEHRAIAEIATLLEVSNNVVEVRLHRARQRLKAKLTDLVQD